MMDGTIATPLGADDPQRIGGFSIIGLLGVGGMGEVYLGVSGRSYAAVKRVRPRLVSSERFEREVGILYRVPPGIGPRVLASDCTAERPWFAAEYVPGLTVDEAVGLHGPLPAEALWLLLAEAATHLLAVHASGIVHRDVKPGNVMLVRDGVKLIDFGIARAADQARLTRSGSSYGTQGFSAPEQQAGNENAGAPADVYALGALVLYAASGLAPGAVPDAGPLHAVDAALAALVGSCLAIEPAARPTADEVVEAARGYLPVPPPAWPFEVMARIAARRAFAATPIGKQDTVPPSDLDTDPEPEPEPGTVPPSPEPSRRPRGRRFLVPAVAALSLGAVVALAVVLSAHRPDGATPASSGARAAAGPVAGTAGVSSASPGRTSSPSADSGRTAPVTPVAEGTAAGNTSDTDTAAPPGTGGGRPPSRPTAPTAPTASSAAPVHITSWSIGGVNGGDDPAQVNGSEADTSWAANDAACSAWLDDSGSGGLAGVLNTSLGQSCAAELHRSDGIAYTFSASFGAARTSFVPGAGHTMWICVWNTNDRSSEQCSPHFAMNGHSPVKG